MNQFSGDKSLNERLTTLTLYKHTIIKFLNHVFYMIIGSMKAFVKLIIGGVTKQTLLRLERLFPVDVLCVNIINMHDVMHITHEITSLHFILIRVQRG